MANTNNIWIMLVHVAEDRKSAWAEYCKDTGVTNPREAEEILRASFQKECSADSKEGFMGLSSNFEEFGMWDAACDGYKAYTKDGYVCMGLKGEKPYNSVVFFPEPTDVNSIYAIPCEVR